MRAGDRKKISILTRRHVGQDLIFRNDPRSRGWNETYLQILLQHQCEDILAELLPKKELRLFNSRGTAQDALRQVLKDLGVPFPAMADRETEKRIITMETIENDNVGTETSTATNAPSKKKTRSKKKTASKKKTSKKAAAPSKSSKRLAKKATSKKTASKKKTSAKTGTGGRKSGIGAYVKELILKGKTREQTLALARQKFGAKVPDYYYAWYRRDLEKKGQLKGAAAKKTSSKKKTASKRKKTSKKAKAKK